MGRLLNQLQTQGRLQVPKESPKQGFFEGVKEDLVRRQQADVKSVASQLRGEQTLGETGLQLLGQGAGFGLDILGRGLGKIATAVTPDVIEKPIREVAGKAISKVAESEKVKNIVAAYKDWKALNPRAARNFEATVNIASVLPVETGLGVAAKTSGKVAGTTGRALERGAVSALETERVSFARRLVRPIQTKVVKEAEVARTREVGFGPFKRSVIEPNAKELRAQEAVLSIPEVSPKKTYQQNYNVIREANEAEAVKLKDAVLQNDFIYPKKELKAVLNTTKKTLSENPTIVGDAEKTAQKLIDGFEKFIDEQPGKGSGILQARKNFDAWVKSQKGDKVFEPNFENALTIANREIRKVANDFLDKHAPEAGVRESLRKQSALYNALDYIEPKAAKEANTAIGRTFQNMANAVGLKNKIVQQIAAIAGIGGLGAAATFAPGVAVVGLGGFFVYKAGKLILRPELRQLLGKLLQEYERVTLFGKSGTGEGLLPAEFIDDILKQDKRGGFVDFGADIGESGAKGIPKDLDSLAQEARKYNWVRGEGSNLGGKSGDKFFSASEDVAGDYGKIRRIDTNEFPKRPLVVSDKTELADKIGYKGDPFAEPIKKLGQNFDDIAKQYAQKNGYDSILYRSGSFDEAELHVFNKIDNGLEALTAEARKYKSAEEFVKAQTLYHGTDLTPEVIKKEGLRLGQVNARGEESFDVVGGYGIPPELYATKSPKYALDYGRNLIEIDKNKLNLATGKQAEQILSELDRVAKGKSDEQVATFYQKYVKQGIDGIDDPTGQEIILFRNIEPSELINKSQLTDFYNQVVGKND